MRRGLWAACVTAVGMLAPAPASAGAVCIPDAAEDMYPRAAAAFVGTVVERRDDGVFVFDVRESLKGPLPARVEVRDESARSSLSLSGRPGEEIGLVARAGEGGALVTNGCLRTRPEDLRVIARYAAECVPGRREPRRALPEPSLAVRGPRVVLGCARVGGFAERPGPRRVKLVAYRYGPRLARRSSVCVDLVEFATGDATGCGGALPRGAVVVDGYAEHAGRRPLVTGVASTSVARLRVSFRGPSGMPRFPGVAVVRVTDPGILAALRLERPFVRFVAEVQRGASGMSVEARDARGRILDLHRVRAPGPPR